MAQNRYQRGSNVNVPVCSWFERSESDGESWITTGSELIGQRIVRTFRGRHIVGQVTQWLPQGSGDDEPAL